MIWHFKNNHAGSCVNNRPKKVKNRSREVDQVTFAVFQMKNDKAWTAVVVVRIERQGHVQDMS